MPDRLDADKVLEKHWKKLKKLHPGVLNVSVAKKVVDGKLTDTPSITIYVQKKLPLTMLKESEVAPKEIDGIKVDVVELSSPNWTPKKTSVSQLSPSKQQQLVSGVRHPKESEAKSPKRKAPKPRLDSLKANWSSLAQPIQDQLYCGSCLAFGVTGVWEIRHRQVYNEEIKLSEQHLFTCSGGLCSEGNTVMAVMEQALCGVALEQDLPYKQGSGKDFTCREGIKDGWYTRAKKLSDWYTISDKTVMRRLIAMMPLVAVMAVHQSFLNYGGGVYHSLGEADPVKGYHCIGCLGADDDLVAWLLRNSWGTDWGESGYCWIQYGDSQIDDTMYIVVPSQEPVPNPGPEPSPSPCSVAKFFCKYSLVLPGNPALALFGRDTRWVPIRRK